MVVQNEKTIKSECVKAAQPDLLFTPTSNSICIYIYVCNVVLNESRAEYRSFYFVSKDKVKNLAKSVGNKI